MEKIFLITLLTFSFQIQAQDFSMPGKTEAGKCYCRSTENSKTEWKEIDCELIKLKKDELISLQYKLKNLIYDVDITGCIDEKTTTAYNIEKKEKKKRERRERKELRKARKKKRTLV